jgi:hypothetical protein
MRSGSRFVWLRCTPCGKACLDVQVRACKSERERTQDATFLPKFAAWPFFKKDRFPPPN